MYQLNERLIAVRYQKLMERLGRKAYLLDYMLLLEIYNKASVSLSALTGAMGIEGQVNQAEVKSALKRLVKADLLKQVTKTSDPSFRLSVKGALMFIRSSETEGKECA